MEAGANDKVLVYARHAAVEAAAAGAHREAARFLVTALERADQLASADRAELLESQSYELYLTDRIDEAITAREQAVRLREKEGDRVAVGAGHRWIWRLSWFAGRREKAERHAARAAELLEGAGDLRELGFAYSNRAQLAMIAGNEDAAVGWGELALEVAEKLGDAEIRAHALYNIGTPRDVVGDPQGRQMQLESIALARERGLDEHVARGYTNVAWNDVESRNFTHGEQMLREGIAFTTQRDLDAWRRYMLGCRARLHLLRGRLTAARAEHAWVTGITPDLDQLRDVHRQAVGLRDAWLMGEVASWLHRLGEEVEETSDQPLPEPYALELAGEHMAATAAWRELGCPYEAALAMADSGAGPGMLQALELLTELGTEGSARRIRQRLRELGVPGVPRGPRATTRANPALLTARQFEVVGLLAAGLTNAEIADELVISTKTAGHHVSAILDKLGARSQLEAANMARELGLTS